MVEEKHESFKKNACMIPNFPKILLGDWEFNLEVLEYVRRDFMCLNTKRKKKELDN